MSISFLSVIAGPDCAPRPVPHTSPRPLDALDVDSGVPLEIACRERRIGERAERELQPVAVPAHAAHHLLVRTQIVVLVVGDEKKALTVFVAGGDHRHVAGRARHAAALGQLARLFPQEKIVVRRGEVGLGMAVVVAARTSFDLRFLDVVGMGGMTGVAAQRRGGRGGLHG